MAEQGQKVYVHNTVITNMHCSYCSTGQFKNKADKEQASSLITCLMPIESVSSAMQPALRWSRREAKAFLFREAAHAMLFFSRLLLQPCRHSHVYSISEFLPHCKQKPTNPKHLNCKMRILSRAKV
jgi:hypothetical protein